MHDEAEDGDDLQDLGGRPIEDEENNRKGVSGCAENRIRTKDRSRAHL